MRLQLLKKPDRPDLPADYLVTRLRSKRRRLRVAEDQSPWPGEAPEQGYRLACRWVFDRLEPPLLRPLEPYFSVLAGQDLVVALRLARAGEQAQLTGLLRESLLAPKLCRLLETTGDFDRLVLKLEQTLWEHSSAQKSLYTTYCRQGPGGLEEHLESFSLAAALKCSQAKSTRQLLKDLIDMRNLLAVFKHWRWQVMRAPVLIEGGRIEISALQKIWARQSQAALTRLAFRQAGARTPLPDSPQQMEQLLLNGIGRRLLHAGQDLLGPGLVLDYLWRCRMARQRQLLVRHAGTSPQSSSMEELVLS